MLKAYSNSAVAMQINATGVSLGTAVPAVALDLSAKTDAIRVPSGTEAQRPASPQVGDIRYNEDDDVFEGYRGSTPSWGSLAGTAAEQQEQVQDWVGAMFSNGTNINASYDDVNNAIIINSTVVNTDDLSEGSSNQYYTATRGISQIQGYLKYGTGIKAVSEGSGAAITSTISWDTDILKADSGISKTENSDGSITLKFTGGSSMQNAVVDARLKTLIDGNKGLKYNPASGTLTGIDIDYDDATDGGWQDKTADFVGNMMNQTRMNGITYSYSTANRQISMSAAITPNDVTASGSPATDMILTYVNGDTFRWQTPGMATIADGSITSVK